MVVSCELKIVWSRIGIPSDTIFNLHLTTIKDYFLWLFYQVCAKISIFLIKKCSVWLLSMTFWRHAKGCLEHAMKVDTLNRLRRNNRAMIRWICNVRAKDEVSSDSLLTKLGIQDLDVVLHTTRMRWFGHVERSIGWIAEVRKLNVVAQKRSGRPRKSWDEVLENDRKKLGMDSADPQNRSEWRGRLRERLVKNPTLGRGKQGSKMDMMTMMMRTGENCWKTLSGMQEFTSVIVKCPSSDSENDISFTDLLDKVLPIIFHFHNKAWLVKQWAPSKHEVSMVTVAMLPLFVFAKGFSC